MATYFVFLVEVFPARLFPARDSSGVYVYVKHMNEQYMNEQLMKKHNHLNPIGKRWQQLGKAMSAINAVDSSC